MGSAVLPAALAGGSAISGLVGANASSNAASAQQQAAQQATQAQLAMYKNNAANLQPFIQSGLVGQDALMRAIPTLIKPFQPTMAQLAATPGYQFALQQGQLGTQNSFAAQGLGTSGAALKGAANYAEGLASTTYQQQFQNDLSSKSQQYNMLAGPGSQGLSAASALSGVGSATGQQIGNNLIGAGNAAAGGQIGIANSLGQGLNGAVGNYAQGQLYSQLLGQGGGGGNDPNNAILGPYQGSPVQLQSSF